MTRHSPKIHNSYKGVFDRQLDDDKHLDVTKLSLGFELNVNLLIFRTSNTAQEQFFMTSRPIDR